MLQLENKSIVIATHVYATGPAFDLRDYLRDRKIAKLLFIGHPLFYDPKLRGSGYEMYSFGEQVKEVYSKIRQIPSIVSYIKDICLDLIYVLKTGQKWDLYVGNDPLNAIAGVMLKRLGRVAHVAYYVIDYNPHRFKNSLLNKLYHWLDQSCVRSCDVTWNLSPRMAEGRRDYFRFEDHKQMVVPIGVWYDRIERLPLDSEYRYTLAFMGHVIEKQGVQYVIKAIPEIVKHIPDFQFMVIGGGNYINTLKQLVTELHVESHVTFTGYVDDHHEVEQLLAKCACAIAMYEKHVDGELSFTYFADPGKIKSYLAAGLPVLLSDVSYNAKEIEQKECGKVIDADPQVIAKAVVNLLQDESTLMRYRENAVEYARQFNWPVIFESALEKIL